MFEGIYTALITPFKNGEVDYKSLKNLLKDQLDKKITGFVVHGTTAESPTTTAAEKEKILEFVKSEVSGQVPLILGTGSNSTAETIEKTKNAKGVQGVLVVVPYYNKPPQRGLYEHFSAVAQSTNLPVILYNVPGRTITSMELETIVKLSEIDNIVGIKEATGNIEFGEQIIKNTKDFCVLSGDDKTFLGLADKGGKGVIAVVSHLIPDVMVKLYRELKSGNKNALREYEKYFDLIDSIYLEANPIPVKYALYKKKIIDTPDMRLPLVTLHENFKAKLDKALEILL